MSLTFSGVSCKAEVSVFRGGGVAGLGSDMARGKVKFNGSSRT